MARVGPEAARTWGLKVMLVTVGLSDTGMDALYGMSIQDNSA